MVKVSLVFIIEAESPQLVALPVPVHFAGVDHQLEDMPVAVIRASLPEQDKRRRKEMHFIRNFGTPTLGGLNQDFSFT